METKEKKEVYPDTAPYTKGLNPDQLKAFDALVAFVKQQDYSMFCLKGYAGTGKTFVMTRFIKWCTRLKRESVKTVTEPRHSVYNSSIKIAMTAPTNKAVQVLREMSDKELTNSKKIQFKTIHSLLGLKEVIDESGTIEFRNDFDSPRNIEDMNVVVIDEVSMLNDELFFEIKNFNNRIKIILMGDPMQIPPVGKPDCEPFLNPQEHQITVVELTQIMRQKEGSQIAEAGFVVRNNPTYEHPHNFPSGNEVMLWNAHHQRKELAEYIIQQIQRPDFAVDNDSMKVIAWRNKKVAQYNKFIREHYFKTLGRADKLSRIEVQDRLITNKPYVKKDEVGKDYIALTTNQDAQVIAAFVESDFFTTTKGTFKLSYYVVTVKIWKFEIEQWVEEEIKVLHETSETEFNRGLKMLKDAALYAPQDKKKFFWKEYYAFQRHFADVTYSYAVTAHKSQGSTYRRTIVDVNDICANTNIEERNRILYTAVTRAKDKLILIN